METCQPNFSRPISASSLESIPQLRNSPPEPGLGSRPERLSPKGSRVSSRKTSPSWVTNTVPRSEVTRHSGRKRLWVCADGSKTQGTCAGNVPAQLQLGNVPAQLQPNCSCSSPGRRTWPPSWPDAGSTSSPRCPATAGTTSTGTVGIRRPAGVTLEDGGPARLQPLRRSGITPSTSPRSPSRTPCAFLRASETSLPARTRAPSRRAALRSRGARAGSSARRRTSPCRSCPR